MNRPRLLVSVRNAAEVSDAAEADLLDLKEPSRGSLGMASPEMFDAVFQAVQRLPAQSRPQLSAALGEVIDWETPALRTIDRADWLRGFSYLKLGMAGLRNQANWVERWRSTLRFIDEISPEKSQTWVAVAYADADRVSAPSVRAILEAAPTVGCGGFLIDTAVKDHTRLHDHLSTADLQELIAAAKSHGLFVALAGRLTIDDLSHWRDLPANIWAVRSAVCHGSDRTQLIDPARVTECRKRLQFVA